MVVLPADGCSSLVPVTMKTPLAHATLGDSGDAALDWQLYGVAETGVVNVANNNIVSGWSIVSACEARDRKAAERINAPFWQFWK